MKRDELLHELHDIDGELRCAAKHLAHNRARNCQSNAEIAVTLSECHADRLESNQLLAKRNEILQQLAQPTGWP
jgi:hypothetical protein